MSAWCRSESLLISGWEFFKMNYRAWRLLSFDRYQSACGLRNDFLTRIRDKKENK